MRTLSKEQKEFAMAIILGELQELFMTAQSKLTLYANELGYGVRGKHLMRCEDCKVGKENSVHKDSLAIDLVLSIRGTVTWDDTHYNILHDKWDTLGGAPRIANDLGHFSFAYKNRW